MIAAPATSRAKASLDIPATVPVSFDTTSAIAATMSANIASQAAKVNASHERTQPQYIATRRSTAKPVLTAGLLRGGERGFTT